MKKLTLFLSLFAILGFTNFCNAQICSCPFEVRNLLQCDIIVSVEVVDANCIPLCSVSGVTITAGSSYFTSCCNSNGGYDVYVSWYSPIWPPLSVNGVSSPSCNVSTLNLAQTTGPIAGCSGNMINMVWSCNLVKIQ